MSGFVSVPAAVAAALALAVAWVCWRVVEWVWVKPKTLERRLRQQGFSGNPYRFWCGDTKDISKMRKEALSKPIAFTNDILPHVIPELHHTIHTYGKNSFLWKGPEPAVYISQPDLIREVFNRTNDFERPNSNPFLGLLIPGLLSYEGDKWAKHRKLLNPAFHMESLKLMLPSFYASCVEMINTWEKMVDKTGFIELDVQPYLVKLSADVISRATFGSSFEEGRRIFELLNEQIELIFPAFQSIYIPGWRFLPTKFNRKLNKVNEEIQTLLLSIIEKRKKAMEAGEAAAKNHLLGTLMENAFQSKMQHGNDHKKQLVGVTMREVIDECKLFYLAGQETTSALLMWTIIMLSKHQEWQERAREEVLKAFGNKKPDFVGLNQLKTVTMILYEVLRLYPPALATARMPKHDVKLGKFLLPAGVMVTIPIMLVHQDPEIWGDDAKEFIPERFSEGVVKATGGNNAFFPFGWGPKICIGQNFALVEVKLALTLILQRFYFELSPSYTHAPSSVITLQPLHGVHIVLHQL